MHTDILVPPADDLSATASDAKPPHGSHARGLRVLLNVLAPPPCQWEGRASRDPLRLGVEPRFRVSGHTLDGDKMGVGHRRTARSIAVRCSREPEGSGGSVRARPGNVPREKPGR